MLCTALWEFAPTSVHFPQQLFYSPIYALIENNSVKNVVHWFLSHIKNTNNNIWNKIKCLRGYSRWDGANEKVVYSFTKRIFSAKPFQRRMPPSSVRGQVDCLTVIAVMCLILNFRPCLLAILWAFLQNLLPVAHNMKFWKLTYLLLMNSGSDNYYVSLKVSRAW